MIYFTSDEHHFHEQIIDYCQQPFSSLESKMDTIIENHNSRVTKEDSVIHVGDFSLFPDGESMYGPMWGPNGKYDKIKELMTRYKKVHERILIIGNHDEFSIKEYKEMGFDAVQEYMTFSFDKYTFFTAHDPSFYQPKIYDRICICGHVHSLFKTIPDRKIFNASVDVNSYLLVSINEVILTLRAAGNLK